MTSAASEPVEIGTPGFCNSCPYWNGAIEPGADRAAKGTCRRLPPVPMPSAGQAWPTTRFDGWCGEHPARAPKPHMLSAEDAAWIRGLDIKASMRPGATLATRKRKAA